MPRENGFYQLQFTGPVHQEWKDELQAMGVTLHEYRQLYSYLVEMPPTLKQTVENLAYVAGISTYAAEHKFRPDIVQPGEYCTFEVYLFAEASGVAQKIEHLGGVVSEVRSDRLTISIDAAQVPFIAKIPHVKSIAEGGNMHYLCNEDATWITQTGTYGERAVTSHGIIGSGELLTVMDSELYASHEMFADPQGDPIGNNHRKIQSMQAYGGGSLSGGNYHGTHVTGTVLGDAPDGSTYATYNKYDGHAIGARVIFQDIDDTDDFWGAVYPPSDLQPPMQDSYNAGSRMQTNSWGGGSGYTDDALEIDTFTWNHKDYNVLFAMGNSGSSANTISEQPEAKNAISVGAVRNYNSHHDVASFSSRGYADDGRIKPTVMGVGDPVTSSRNSGTTDYYDMSGTSMATPGIAGQVGQIRQYFNQGWYPTGDPNAPDGFNPSAALVKAVLVNGAEEISGSGAYANDARYPNGDQGWGRSNLDNALYFDGDARKLQIYDSWNQGLSLSTGNTYEMTFEVSDTGEPVEVTLVWTDYVGPSGASSSSPALVNDLDLEVWKPSGTRYVGNAFTGYNPGYSQANPTSNHWSGLRSGEYDGLNVVENVLLLPGYNGVETGTYTVRVTAHNVPQGPQPFALVITGGLGAGGTPPSITVTDPNGGEILQAGTTFDITWTTTPGDGTITGVDLEYSTDGGSSYTSIVTDTADDGLYTWTVPDDASTTCLLRATVRDDAGRSGSDTSDAYFEIVGNPPSPPSGLTVEHYGTQSAQDTASSAVVGQGTATNDYTSTHVQDDVYHAITEAYAGGPSNRAKYSLEVTYTVSISGSTSSPYTFHLDAYRADSEAYDVYYQVNGGGYTFLGQITAGSDSDAYLSWQLPGVSAGATVDIRILDTQESIGETQGVLYVDHLYIESAGSGSGTDDNRLTWNASPDDGGGANDVNHYDVYRSSSSSGPWDTVYDTVAADGLASYSYIDSGAGTADATYWWYVVRAVDADGLDDGNTNAVQEPMESNDPPSAPTDPSPADGATGVDTSPTLSVYVSDPDGDSLAVSFYNAADNSLIGTDTGVPSGSTASVTWSGLAYSTTYTWYAVADDGLNSTQSATWQFTTMSEPQNTPPDAPTDPS
ncbi:MAG: S8 family serine peptidase, partial [Thermoplasmatota archaeon]